MNFGKASIFLSWGIHSEDLNYLLSRKYQTREHITNKFWGGNFFFLIRNIPFQRKAFSLDSNFDKCDVYIMSIEIKFNLSMSLVS